MFGSNVSDGSAVRLKHALSDYREDLLNYIDLYPLIDPIVKPEIQSILDTSDKHDPIKGVISWEEYHYGDYTLVGVLTFLNHTRLDIRTAEDIMLGMIEKKTKRILDHDPL